MVRSGWLRGAALLMLFWFGQPPVTAADYRAGDLVIARLWSRPTAPAASVGAVYFSIVNRGREADRLLDVSSPIAKKVELHESLIQHGSVAMRRVQSVECAPGVIVKSEPGGLHVMLVGLTHPLVAGASFPLVLRFRAAGMIEVQVLVGNPE